jgi:hypothetical protein
VPPPLAEDFHEQVRAAVDDLRRIWKGYGRLTGGHPKGIYPFSYLPAIAPGRAAIVTAEISVGRSG